MPVSEPTSPSTPSDRHPISGIVPHAAGERGRASGPGPDSRAWRHDHAEPDEALSGHPVATASPVERMPADRSQPGGQAVNRPGPVDRERLLDELARRVAGRGFRIAYDLLRNREQAEDAVQESLARACEQAHRIRELDALDGWFYRVLTNLCLRTLRRRRVRRFILGERADQDEASVLPDGRERPADMELAHARAVTRLFGALERVPTKQRVALLLRYGHDLSIAEIADMLNVRKATVKTHLVRGLERLRSIMEHET